MATFIERSAQGAPVRTCTTLTGTSEDLRYCSQRTSSTLIAAIGAASARSVR